MDEEELEKIEEALVEEATEQELDSMKLDNRSIFTIRDTISERGKDAE